MLSVRPSRNKVEKDRQRNLKSTSGLYIHVYKHVLTDIPCAPTHMNMHACMNASYTHRHTQMSIREDEEKEISIG